MGNKKQQIAITILIKALKRIFYKLCLLFPYSFGKVKKYYLKNEKAVILRFIDLFLWILRDNFFNIHYYAWGLNIKGKKQSDFIGRKEFLSIKNKVERKIKLQFGNSKISYEAITKDKFYSNAIFMANNLPGIPVLGLVSSEEIFYTSGRSGSISELFEMKEPFVLKNTILEAGDGFLLCKPNGNALIVNGISMTLNDLKKKLGYCRWVLQSQIKSNTQIQKINDSALNTTRIVTILDVDKPVFLSGFQSFATNNCEIDSWGKGAIYVGIDIKKKCLRKYGYYHPQVNNESIVEEHPDSGIVFEKYIINDLSKAVKLCIKAHKLLYPNFIIGWDVALTNNGPLIVEANEKPGMNAVQCIDGGLKSIIKLYSEKNLK